MTRRPLATRSAGWAKALARGLARTRVTPNAISMASVLFAGLACVAFWASRGVADGWLVVAAAAIQLRLLCNLLDGMVAVEGGKASADGAFWNEFPDRVADILILVGAGLGAAEPTLGWAAAGAASAPRISTTSSRTSVTTGSRASNGNSSSSANAPLFFKRLGKLSGFHDSQLRQFFNKLGDIGHDVSLQI